MSLDVTTKKKEVFSIAMMISSYKWYLQKHTTYIFERTKKKQPIKIMMMFGYAN